MFKKNNKGFTLVELLVVIAIIAILAAVIAPNAFKAIEKSKVSAIISDYRAVKIATLVYYSDVGDWPENDAGEIGFVKDKEAKIPGWNGPYLDVWTGKSPLGSGYTLLTETDGTAAASCKDKVAPAVYLTIKDLSNSAFLKLKAELGEAIVFLEDSTVTTDQNVHLKIATK